MASSVYGSEFEWDRIYVDGEWCETSGNELISVKNPATQENFAEVPAATEADIDTAYEAAEAAQPAWRATPREERNDLVQKVQAALKEEFGEVVNLLATESGSVQNKAAGEVAISMADFEMALNLESPDEVRDSAFFDAKESHIVHEPVGVIGIISPWNFPLHLSTRALAPALTLGNTVVLKPASNTPITGGLMLAKICEEVGIPDGVVNVVTGHGSDIGERMANHPVPRVISFTGSTAVGKQVASRAGNSLALPALELGGNAPYVVVEDANLDQAVAAGAYGSFFHQGQACISINRHLVHEKIYDEYVEGLVELAESFNIGDPSTDDSVTFGPIINETQCSNLLGFVEQTIKQGATLETGGDADGLFFQPTVLSDATNDMAAACNEHFGPVAPVIPISSDDEAIELANDTEYGLSAAVQCGDSERARTLANQIEAGMVHINDHPIQDEPNAPFGGVKASGLGRYNGEWIHSEFTEPKWISVQTEDREYDLP